MDATTVGVIGIAVLISLFFTQMPISFVMALIGFLGFSYLGTLQAGLNLLAKDIFQVFSSEGLTVVPLFILMGQIAFYSRMGARLYDSAYRFIGHLPGGLAMATVGACAGFAAICGSTIATATTMAAVALPEMRRYGYDIRLAAGTVAAGGTLGILIPPSTIFIVYGIFTQQSIGRLFAAGILPGILLAGLFAATIYVAVKRKPELVSLPSPHFTLRERLRGLSGAGEMILIFGLVMGGLFGGWFTPTEAAAVGAMSIFLLALIRRQLSPQAFKQALVDTAKINCMILMIIACSTVFGHFMAVTRIPYDLAGWVGGLPLPRSAILLLIICVYLIGGCFMDGLAFLLLTIPIFYPVIQALKYDPIWFGVMIVLLTEIAAITPPVGINVYSVSGAVKEIPLEDIFRGIFIFLIPLGICMLILIAFPDLALFLPNLLD
jgi:tripartite ATP-independent transporter DctM subunit